MEEKWMTGEMNDSEARNRPNTYLLSGWSGLDSGLDSNSTADEKMLNLRKALWLTK